MAYDVRDPLSCPACLRRCGLPHLAHRAVLIAWRDGHDSVMVPWANGTAPSNEPIPYPDGTLEAWAWLRGRHEAFLRRAVGMVAR